MALYDELMKPQNLGLFGMAGGLLEAGGPSRMPTSLGQGLNRGFLQGAGLARQGEQDLQAKAYQDEKMKFMQAQALMEQLKYLQSIQPKQPEPFKLREKERMYSPQGQVIAENAGPVVPPPTRTVTRDDKVVTQSFIDGKWVDEDTGLKFNPRPQVDVKVPINLAANKYAETVGAGIGKEDIETHKSALEAVEGINKTNELLRHLKTSSAITGLGADFFTNVQRVKALVLKDKAAGKQVSDTQILDAFLGSDVFPMIGALGIGARGLDTPAEREYLRKVMTGTIEMDKEALIKLTKIRNDIGRRMVSKWNAKVKSGELDKYFEAAQRPKELIKMPQDQDVEDWISRAMRANMATRERVISEGRKLGKVPQDYE